jgi:hypothetical protein
MPALSGFLKICVAPFQCWFVRPMFSMAQSLLHETRIQIFWGCIHFFAGNQTKKSISFWLTFRPYGPEVYQKLGFHGLKMV